MYSHLMSRLEHMYTIAGESSVMAVAYSCPPSLQEKVPLAWVNQPLFDFRDSLRSGTVTLPCWLVSPEAPLEELLNPIGQSVSYWISAPS